MANGTGSAKEAGVHTADKSNVINPENIGNLEHERKDQFLKRVAKENAIGKASFKKTDQWLEAEGKKVLRKMRNAAGSLYTLYLFNRTKYPDVWAGIERKGGFDLTDPETGESTWLPLKSINGKAFAAKKGR